MSPTLTLKLFYESTKNFMGTFTNGVLLPLSFDFGKWNDCFVPYRINKSLSIRFIAISYNRVWRKFSSLLVVPLLVRKRKCSGVKLSFYGRNEQLTLSLMVCEEGMTETFLSWAVDVRSTVCFVTGLGNKISAVFGEYSTK